MLSRLAWSDMGFGRDWTSSYSAASFPLCDPARVCQVLLLGTELLYGGVMALCLFSGTFTPIGSQLLGIHCCPIFFWGFNCFGLAVCNDGGGSLSFEGAVC